jgi:predicted transposase/invertase (TIGR01784 family)
MKHVAPLRYGVIFKKAFCDPEIFTAFVKAVLNIDIEIDKVETEKSFKPPIGKVDCRFDLFAEDQKNRLVVDIQHERSSDHYHRFMYYHIMAIAEQIAKSENYWPKLEVYTIVVLTGSDKHKVYRSTVKFDPQTDEGEYIGEILHKIVYLSPKYINAKTPEPLRQWLRAIEDTLDEHVDETAYDDPRIQRVFDEIEQDLVSPAERAKMFEENNQEELRQVQFEQGLKQGVLNTARSMLADGMEIARITRLTGLSEAEIGVLQN